MSANNANTLLSKILSDLDNVVKAEQIKSVQVLEKDIAEAIKRAEEEFRRAFTMSSGTAH